jgi:hypothetical protein
MMRQAAAIATREGLVVVSDIGPAELTARYLIGSDGQPDGMMVESRGSFTRRCRRTIRPIRIFIRPTGALRVASQAAELRH